MRSRVKNMGAEKNLCPYEPIAMNFSKMTEKQSTFGLLKLDTVTSDNETTGYTDFGLSLVKILSFRRRF